MAAVRPPMKNPEGTRMVGIARINKPMARLSAYLCRSAPRLSEAGNCRWNVRLQGGSQRDENVSSGRSGTLAFKKLLATGE